MTQEFKDSDRTIAKADERGPAYYHERAEALHTLLIRKGIMGPDEAGKLMAQVDAPQLDAALFMVMGESAGPLPPPPHPSAYPPTAHRRVNVSEPEHNHPGSPPDSQSHIPPEEDYQETYYDKLVIALCNLLIDKKVITGMELLDLLRERESQNPGVGARVVARAWVDPEFKGRLLGNGRNAVGELGIDMKDIRRLRVVENTASVHHMVVCTLCSCYPIPLLGYPPEWYKSDAYRIRAITEPRSVLKEFGLELGEDVRLRVLDSTARIRYLVLPMRPDGTEGMSEEALAALVTRDSMIGTGQAISLAQS
jgi:nitrile hydratase